MRCFSKCGAVALALVTFNTSALAQPSDRRALKVEWLRRNPHRLHLGRIGFRLTKADGTPDGAPDRPVLGFPDDGSWTVRWDGIKRLS